MALQDLLVWQKAIDLSVNVYNLTKSFPDDEKYRLSDRLRRSGASVPSNIADGEGRLTPGERRQALSHARGSLYEVGTQLIIAARLGYVPEGTLQEDVAEVRRMMDAYIAYVRRTGRR